MKNVAILQSNYIPWKGYFDIIRKSDLFIFHDDLQYTKGDWRNRNKIKTNKGTEWLTIPCGSSENRMICEVKITDLKWQKEHWNKIVQHYKQAPFFNEYSSFFEPFYLDHHWEFLSELNQKIIVQISKEILNLKTDFDDSRNYSLTMRKQERVIELLKKCDATDYISGPAAKNYLSEETLLKNGIKVHWMDYNHYPEYHQLFPPFEHQVSILDLIFNEGPAALSYLTKKS